MTVATALRRPVVVDTELARIWGEQAVARNRFDSDRNFVHSLLGERKTWVAKRSVWSSDDQQAEDTLRAVLAEALASYAATGKYDIALALKPWNIDNAKRTLASIDAQRVTMADLTELAKPLQDEFWRERWTRFFLVTNANGHIHRDMNCATCHPTTRYAWLPNLSGLGEDAAVADQGPRLCSVCFPSAPVEWTLGLPAKVNPDRCPGSSEQALNVSYRYNTPRGKCAVCGTGVAASSTGKARPHKIPKD